MLVNTMRADMIDAYAVPPNNDNPWLIMDEPSDKNGNAIPVRRGKRGTGGEFAGGFGYEKFSVKHNVTSLEVVRAAITRGSIVPKPERQGINYEGHLVGQAPNGVNVDEKIVVVTRPSHYSTSMRANSPDGKSVGVITAYCTRKMRCPNEINDLGASGM